MLYLHIGASRAGSTWLYDNLSQHPELINPLQVKNTYFWNGQYAASVGKQIPSAEVYHKAYSGAVSTSSIFCDFTDANSWIEQDRISQISEMYPDVKLTYCLRNPITTLWSHVVRLTAGAEAVSATEIVNRMLDTDGSTLFAGRRIPPQVKFFNNVQYEENYKKWERVFPSTNIHSYLFTDILTDGQQCLNGITTFLGISQRYSAKAKIVTNAGRPTPVSPTVMEMILPHVEPQIQFAENLFNCNLDRWRRGEE